MNTINEKTTANVKFSFFDAEGNHSTPLQVYYRVDDFFSNTTVRDWTSITANANVRITLTANDNIIINSKNPMEKRAVTVRAVYGLSPEDYATEEVQYQVKNLRFL